METIIMSIINKSTRVQKSLEYNGVSARYCEGNKNKISSEGGVCCMMINIFFESRKDKIE
jgi:hypothetical protein